MCRCGASISTGEPCKCGPKKIDWTKPLITSSGLRVKIIGESEHEICVQSDLGVALGGLYIFSKRDCRCTCNGYTDITIKNIQIEKWVNVYLNRATRKVRVHTNNYPTKESAESARWGRKGETYCGAFQLEQ